MKIVNPKTKEFNIFKCLNIIMSLWDILYDVIKEYRKAKGNEVQMKYLAISICKKAYLRFNFEWNSEIQSGRIENAIQGQKDILSQYSQLFLDIAVEIFDTLPEESDRMKEIASKMKKGAYTLVTLCSPRIIPEGDECAKEVREREGVLNIIS